MSALPPELESPEQARARLQRQGVLDEAERAQLWRRIEHSRGGARRGARPLLWAPALAAVAALLALALLGRDAPVQQRAGSKPVDACALDAAASDLRLPADCAPQPLRVGDDEWLMEAGAHVEREPQGARVLEGMVRFSVRRRPAGERFRVRVSHGRVVVIGTVFRVEQHADGGSVHVTEGVIEFVWTDGTRERVAAGQTLRWPRPAPAPAEEQAEPEPEAQASEPARRPAPGSEDGTDASTDMEQVIGRLLQLRSQRRHGEAVALLRETLQAPDLGGRQRARISYELGVCLEASGQPACSHWRRHRARFGGGQHAAELEQRLAACPDP